MNTETILETKLDSETLQLLFQSSLTQSTHNVSARSNEPLSLWKQNLTLSSEVLMEDSERPVTPVSEDNEEERIADDESSEPLLLPLSRVRKIIRYDSEVTTVREDAVTAIARATELFLEYFLEETYREASARSRGRVRRLTYDDFSKTVQEIDALHFLAEVIPPRKRFGSLQGTWAGTSNQSGNAEENEETTEAGTMSMAR
jgi:histone H3/H4